MILIFSVIFIILLFGITIVSVVLLLNAKKEQKLKYSSAILDFLDSKIFYSKKIVEINKYTFLAINKDLNKLAIIENFNYGNLSCNYTEVVISFIVDVAEINSGFRIDFIHQGEKRSFLVNSHSKEIKDFIYKVFKSANIKRIKDKFPDNNFTISSASDFKNTYVWAYSPINCTFAYFKTKEKPIIQKINLRKKHFTIDVKYDYFEAPVFGENQQLFCYEHNFLNELFNSMFQTIKQKTSQITENLIYFDDYNNIVYISNGYSSLQSLILGDIEEVYYKDKKLLFTTFDDAKMINFPADNDLIKEFEDFVTGYNLRKIANNFDYKIDKLINTTQNTKLVIDFSRDRIVYCANLNTFSRFSYLTISFMNLEDVTLEKNGSNYFVRIFAKEKEILDVSCNKNDVAKYIFAQIRSIINK